MTRRDHPAQAPSGMSGKGSHPAWALALGMAAALALSGPAAAQSPSGSAVLTDDEGTQVTLASSPSRVVSLSPANTEIMFALGAGGRLVGGTDADVYPPEAAVLPDVVSQTKVLLEQVVALEPELILAGGNGFTPAESIAHLRQLGYPVLVLYPETVDGVLGDISLIGEALGGDAVTAARDMVASMDADMDAISALAASTAARPRTLYEIYYGPDVFAPAEGSFIADMVVLAGAEPVTTGDPVLFSVPVEQLILADPEIIVLGDALYGTCPDAVAARPGWDAITAVRTGAIRTVNDTIISSPGPRLADGLASLARAIHPELAQELAGFPADPPMCETAGSPSVLSSSAP